MKLRSKLLALMVISTSFSGAYADGCGGGGHGRFSFGNGGFSFGPMHFQSPGHQFQQNYSAPCQHSVPSSYQSSPQVIYSDSSSGSRVYPQHGQPIPSNQPIGMNQGQPSQMQPQIQPGQIQPGQMQQGQMQNQMQGSQMQSPNQMQQPQLQSSQGNPFPGQLVSASGNPGQNFQANSMNGMSQAMPGNGMNGQTQMQPGQSAPVNGSQPMMQNRPQQSGGMPGGTGSQGSIPNGNGSGISALQILGSMSSTTGDMKQPVENVAGTATASQIPPSHFGTWVVNMNGNQMIRLSLNQNNTFVWSVIKDGNESRLEGQYRLDGQRLILVRSSDLQQMAGSWTGNGSNFTFKLDGASDNGLPFARAQ